MIQTGHLAILATFTVSLFHHLVVKETTESLREQCGYIN